MYRLYADYKDKEFFTVVMEANKEKEEKVYFDTISRSAFARPSWLQKNENGLFSRQEAEDLVKLYRDGMIFSKRSFTRFFIVKDGEKEEINL